MYCPYCAMKLPDDARFCTRCGKSVTPLHTGKHSKESAAALEALAALEAEPLVEPVVQPYGQQQYAKGNTSPFDRYAEAAVGGSKGRKPLPMWLVAIVATVAALLFISMLYLLVLAPMLSLPRPGGSSTTPPSAAVVASEQAPSATSAASEAAAPSEVPSEAPSAASTATGSDADIRVALLGFYNDLNDYNSEVSACANDLNSSLTVADADVRERCAATARNLSSRLHADYDELAALSVPANSAYHQQYTDILTCYDDLCHRVDVLIECWDLSLAYSDPAAHEGEISAPLLRDIVDGNNKYYTDYNSRVKGIRL